MLSVCVAYAEPQAQWVIELELPAGARVRDALAAVSDRPPFAALDVPTMSVGVWGEKVTPEHPLVAHDRVELYRPLQLDPKQARMERARAQESARARESARAQENER